jgi:hypothetical protein
MTGWLSLACSFCLARFRIKEAHAHLRGRCPACGFRVKAPKPNLYSDKPLRVSDSDEPIGLVPEEEEWPEPAVLIEVEEAKEYGIAPGTAPSTSPSTSPRTPSVAVPQTPEASKDVFALGPEYKSTRPPPATPEPPGEPPIRLVEPVAPPTKSQSFDEFAAGTRADARPTPAAPRAEQRRPSIPPAAPPPLAPDPNRPFDPLLDDILVPAPPRPEAKKPEPKPKPPVTGPRFALPSEEKADAPAAAPAGEPPEEPAISIYNFKDAPPGVSPLTLAGGEVGEFDYIKPSPQVAPLPEPPPKAPEAVRVPPPVAQVAPEQEEVKPASQEELYQYRLSEAERKPYRTPKPPDSPLWTGVWNFAWQPSSLTMLIWLVLGLTVLALQVALFAVCARMWNPEGGAGNVLPGVGMIFIGFSTLLVVLMIGSYAAACLFKIIEETAAGENDIAGPDGGLRVWYPHLFRLSFLMLCGMVACGLFGFCMPALAASLMLLFLWPAVFNTFLLSAMAADSWWILLHGKVLEQLGAKLRVMLALYVWTFVLSAIVMGAWYVATSVSWLFAFVAGPVLAVSCLTYARVVGRVGLLITAEERKGKKKKKRKKKKAIANESQPADENGDEEGTEQVDAESRPLVEEK